MVAVGPRSPTAGASLPIVSTFAWTTPGNIISSNNAYATRALNTSTDESERLCATNFGFTLPTTTPIEILGIMFEVEVNNAATGNTELKLPRVTKDGTNVVGSSLATVYTITNTETYTTWGSATELWGTTWTAAEINASTFGCMIQARYLGTAPGATVQIDHIRMTITYIDLKPDWYYRMMMRQ